MSTETEISNLALSHIGVGVEIQNLETDKSAEAQACRRFYNLARDTTIRDYSWPFATRIDALNLVEEQPNEEWYYSYRYPVGAMKLIKILSGIRNDTRQSRVPYKVGSDETGRLIFTDKESAELEYIFKVTNTELYPPDFEMAFSYILGSLVAARLTKGDPFGMRKAALDMYQIAIDSAKATSKNEEQDEEEPESELIRARV